MSDYLYPTRLRYAHGVGCARYDGVSVELKTAPRICEGVTEIDFIPHVIAVIRIGSEALRDMTQDEAFDALALLQAMSTAARDVLTGSQTLVVVNR